MTYFYHSEKVRKNRLDVLPRTVERIKKWNEADYRLYDHFNQTFWQKVSEYGDGFEQDLLSFQRLNHENRFPLRDLHNTLRSRIIGQMAERGIIYVRPGPLHSIASTLYEPN